MGVDYQARLDAALVEADHRKLFDAVLAALDVPPPATVDGEEEYYRLLDRRATHVREVMRGALEGNDPASEADYLIDRTGGLPADGYRHFDEEDDDE